MKIGMVLYPTFGGSGVVGTELGKALAEKGHEIHFITYDQPVRLGSLRENIFYHEVRVYDYPLFDFSPYELVLSSKLVDVALYHDLDLFHVHYAIPHASAAFMAKQILKTKGRNVPYVTTLHGTDITLVGRDPSFEPVITFAINESDAVTAVSESLKQDTFNHFAINRPVEAIPNFINVDEYADLDGSFIRKRYAPNGEFVLCHISNFRKVKRVPDVIEVFARVRKEIPARLLMVGDGPDRALAEEMCRKLHLCDDVIMLGKLRSTKEILSGSDLFLLPSESESFGLSALEAMAAGVPVISTNTGGIPEVNKHGITGYTSNVGDVDDMARNALSILKDFAHLRMFRDQARETAREYDIQAILPQYEALYEKVLATANQ
jgi:N-acetyl-alpha-D-glucosaminyl L-malate synthase BshA